MIKQSVVDIIVYLFNKIRINYHEKTDVSEERILINGKLSKKIDIQVLNQHIHDRETAEAEIDDIFNSDEFIDGKTIDNIQKKTISLINECETIIKYKKLVKDETILKKTNQFVTRQKLLMYERNIHNKSFTKHELSKYDSFFSSIEGKSMDIEQRVSAVNDDNNTLINAGAGSGKTLTLLGKIKYLTECKGIDPNDILVLMFNRKNAREFNERTEKELGIKKIAYTFHSFGTQIIQKENPNAGVQDNLLEDFIDKTFDELDANPKRLEKYIRLMVCYFDAYLDQYEPTTDESKLDRIIENRSRLKYKTLMGEKTNSFEETVIANFYYMNGVKYSINKPYEKPVSSEGKKVYQPDFSFPEYKGIYHEHFGVDENGKVPPFFKGNGTKSAQEIYTEGIEWKRKIHRENGTTLLETYSYQFRDDKLFDALEDNLKKAGIKPDPENRNKMWTEIIVSQSSSINSFKKLLKTAVEQIKSNKITSDDLRQRNESVVNTVQKMRNGLIIDLVEDIFEDYNAALKGAGKIDFNDMIIDAHNYISNNTVKTRYKYLIIDEYQDISQNRFDLLKAIQKQTDAKLVAVGDDWQSIYRFTGSRVGLFTKFEELNNFAALLPISQTFRYDQCVADVAKKFVTRNPSQLKKDVVSKKPKQFAGIFPIYTNGKMNYYHQLAKVIMGLPRINDKQELMLLGRYNNDIRPLLRNNIIEKGAMNYTFNGRPDLSINYSTIHSSKGLESDFVIIVNNRDDKFGFPSQIEDDKFFELLSSSDEVYPYAEERRLMYVALTRTKYSCYLMIESNSKSVFVRELEEQENWVDPYQSKTHQSKTILCPKCQKGILVERESIRGKFYGCSRYHDYGCDHTENIKIITN
jgi:DNA helicase-4